MTEWAITVLVAMTILGAAASILLKQAADKGPLRVVVARPEFYCGAALYGTCALLNMWVLRYLDYTVVLPATSLTYCWSVLLAWLFLGEKPHRATLLGVALVVAGGAFLLMR